LSTVTINSGKIVENEHLQAHEGDVCQTCQLPGCHSHDDSLVQQDLHRHLLHLHTADLSILYSSRLRLNCLQTCRGRHSADDDDDSDDDDDNKCYCNYCCNITNF